MLSFFRPKRTQISPSSLPPTGPGPGQTSSVSPLGPQHRAPVFFKDSSQSLLDSSSQNAGRRQSKTNQISSGAVPAAAVVAVKHPATSCCVEELEADLSCSICTELLVDAVRLDCTHSFCNICLGKWLSQKHVSCPMCRKLINFDKMSRDADLNAVVELFISQIEDSTPSKIERRRRINSIYGCYEAYQQSLLNTSGSNFGGTSLPTSSTASAPKSTPIYISSIVSPSSSGRATPEPPVSLTHLPNEVIPTAQIVSVNTNNPVPRPLTGRPLASSEGPTQGVTRVARSQSHRRPNSSHQNTYHVQQRNSSVSSQGSLPPPPLPPPIGAAPASSLLVSALAAGYPQTPLSTASSMGPFMSSRSPSPPSSRMDAHDLPPILSLIPPPTTTAPSSTSAPALPANFWPRVSLGNHPEITSTTTPSAPEIRVSLGAVLPPPPLPAPLSPTPPPSLSPILNKPMTRSSPPPPPSPLTLSSLVIMSSTPSAKTIRTDSPPRRIQYVQVDPVLVEARPCTSMGLSLTSASSPSVSVRGPVTTSTAHPSGGGQP